MVLPALALAAVSFAAAPDTFFVRTDGGSAGQCDGRHDAAYGGAGLHQECAWRHPFEALPPGGPARIAGGDTLVIGSGNYRIGAGAAGTDALEKCRRDWPWDCHLAVVPGGPSPAQPTRIVGAGFDRGCPAAPQLWGAERASTVFDLSGSSNVMLACLEITDRSGCIEFHARDTQRCARESPPYGDWASTGISAVDSANVRLRDLDIHGMAHDGIRAARVRDWTLEHVRIDGNGWAGWNGDAGGGASSDGGTLLFRDVEIGWNGCGESWPARRHDGCWGQEQGGYGDGLGTGATGGDWLFDHVDVHDNAQDGIDLLHAEAGATITFRDVHAAGNAGNQLKATGSVRVENSRIDGTCAALATQHGLDAGDACRARGNSILLRLPAGAHASISGDTISGEGDCLIGLECAGEGCASATASVDGNRLSGSQRSGRDARLPCSLWVDPALHGASVLFSHNDVQSTRNAGCPAETHGCAEN